MQTGSVEEYIKQFSELIDQLAAYEARPDPLHYVTRFLEGLKPSVRILVAVQLSQDLDTAYTIALVQEEVGEGFMVLNSPIAATDRKTFAASSQMPRVTDDCAPHRTPDSNKVLPEDKLTVLKNYRRAKGFCFVCGERWVRDHKCQSTVQ